MRPTKRLRKFFAAAALALAALPGCFAEKPAATREPAVSGLFYPADPRELSSALDVMIGRAPAFRTESRIPVFIVPHAGYAYSGGVAAHVYKALEGSRFETVVLIGPSHHHDVRGVSVWTSGDWKTPLGAADVDEALARAIASEDSSFAAGPAAHLKEHSLEVQVPFIQRVLPGSRIVPIAINDPAAAPKLAAAVVKHLAGKKAVVLASTDLSHYRPAAEAQSVDGRTLGLIADMDAEGLARSILAGESELCGAAAVLTALEIARGLGYDKSELLRYAHSGEASGDDARVVGYAAISFRRGTAPGLDARDKEELLWLARRAVETRARGEGEPGFSSLDPDLRRPAAAFVTIRKKDGDLRGCIGTFAPGAPLYETVRRMALAAANEDTRFEPVTAAELGGLKYEISLLSEPRRVANASGIDYPGDGVIIRQGGRSGVFLPKVAEETGWTKEEFLRSLCSEKAGLPANCWKDPGTEIYVFTSEDFSEAP